MPSIREHRGGQFGGELEQGGGASSAGVDAELAESFGHVEGADGLAGLPAGEHPGGGSRVADGGVPVPGRDDLPGQGIEGFGEHDGLVAETQAFFVVAGVDVMEGEAADRRRCLGVEEDEQAGEAVFGFEGVVVDQPAGLPPPGFGVDHPGWSAPADGCEVQSGELVPFGPADEVSRVGAVACLRGGQPCVQVALADSGRVRPRPASQSSRATAALMIR